MFMSWPLIYTWPGDEVIINDEVKKRALVELETFFSA